MLSNAYFLAKFRFDTAENEPAKNLQNFRKNAFSKNAFSKNAFSKNAFSKNAFSKNAFFENAYLSRGRGGLRELVACVEALLQRHPAQGEARGVLHELAVPPLRLQLNLQIAAEISPKSLLKFCVGSGKRKYN